MHRNLIILVFIYLFFLNFRALVAFIFSKQETGNWSRESGEDRQHVILLVVMSTCTKTSKQIAMTTDFKSNTKLFVNKIFMQMEVGKL